MAIIIKFVTIASLVLATVSCGPQQSGPSAQSDIIALGPKPTAKFKVTLLNEVKPGMTLGQVKALLGPGWIHPLSGCGIMEWHADDGTVLEILPKVRKDSEVIGTSDGASVWIIQSSKRIPLDEWSKP